MSKTGIMKCAPKVSHGVVRLFQSISLALVVALALTASAAGERAIKSRVPPVYPELAKRMKIMGVVKVEATVDADGNVTGVKTVDGNRMLSPAAEEAVKKWKFEGGDGVATIQVELKFALAL